MKSFSNDFANTHGVFAKSNRGALIDDRVMESSGCKPSSNLYTVKPLYYEHHWDFSKPFTLTG